VLVSFMMLYQDRLYALLNVFALHALVLALSVAWQAFIQDAPHLYVTAAIALVFKAIVIPIVLHRIIAGSASTARSRRWSASARPCSPAWASSRCRWW
jgi:hydrogenase-4 membrane subunit HyfE